MNIRKPRKLCYKEYTEHNICTKFEKSNTEIDLSNAN